MIKAVLIDFDGTIVTRDLLTWTCGLIGKKEDSRKLNRLYMEGKMKGLTPLITRINFLKGLPVKKILKELEKNDFLMRGAKDFFDYLNRNHIISILTSGNIICYPKTG